MSPNSGNSRFSDTSSFARLSRILRHTFVGNMVLACLMIVSGLMQFWWIGRVDGGYTLSEGTLDLFDSIYVYGDIAQVVLFLLTAGLFLFWLSKAKDNLKFLEVSGLEFTAGWVIGWWFVPFANFVKPYRAVCEIWGASSPTEYEPGNTTSWMRDDDTKVVTQWWTAYIIMIVIEWITSRIYDTVETVSSYQEAMIANVVLDVSTIVAAWFAIKCVVGIVQRQQLRYNRILSDIDNGTAGMGNIGTDFTV